MPVVFGNIWKKIGKIIKKNFFGLLGFIKKLFGVRLAKKASGWVLIQPIPSKKEAVEMYSTNLYQIFLSFLYITEVGDEKRPFQHVEKTCSIVMALLFMLFNALYWPWLLRDEDFDYAKFAATQQNQIKF